MSKQMSTDEVAEFIQRERSKGTKYSDITKMLKDRGHKSPRTGKPLNDVSVRQIYLYREIGKEVREEERHIREGRKERPSDRKLKTSTERVGETKRIPEVDTISGSILALIEGVLEMDIPAEKQVDLIRVALSKSDSR